MQDLTPVLIVVASEDDGGIVRSVALLAGHLPEFGVAVEIATHRAEALGPLLEGTGTPCHVVPELFENLRRDAHGRDRGLPTILANLARLPRLVRALRRLAHEREVELLYGQGIWPSIVAALASAPHPIPFPADDPTAGGTRPLGAVWHIRNPPSRASRLLLRPLARWTNVRAVIAISRAVAAPYVGLPMPLEVVVNGVDLERCAAARRAPVLRAHLGLPRDAVVAGFAGRLVAHKGLDVLLEAARHVLPRLPSLHLVILGGNPRRSGRDVLGEIRSRVSGWGLADRVHLPGFVSDIESHLADLDLVLVPSLFAEPAGRSAIEALVLGVPVIASRVGGLPEMVRDGLDGLLVEPGSAEALAAALERLATDGEARRALAARARAEAPARFDARLTAKRVADILRRCRVPS